MDYRWYMYYAPIQIHNQQNKYEIFNFKIVNLNRTFKQFMLYLLNNDVFAVQKLKPVSGAKLNCLSPTLYRNPEWMLTVQITIQ